MQTSNSSNNCEDEASTAIETSCMEPSLPIPMPIKVSHKIRDKSYRPLQVHRISPETENNTVVDE